MTGSDQRNHLYQDPAGVIHACEGAQLHRDVYLVWTKCCRDVPANKSFKSNERVSCERCVAQEPKP